MTEFVPAEAFPPGEFLKDEIDARNWTQEEFARIIGKAPTVVSDVITGKRAINAELALRFAAAFGTTAQFWLNLESAYRIYELSRTDPAPSRIAQEAELREAFPVRDLIKRNWIKDSEDAEVLRSRVLRFYDVDSVSAPRKLKYAARQTGDTSSLTAIQEAWLYRVNQIASETEVGPYSEKALLGSLEKLSALRSAPEEARHVPRLLAECGVRFAVVEPMARSSRIDGVCFWLAPDKPVIAMSLRRDTIDNFWFVLRHEIEHVLRRDGMVSKEVIVDSQLRDTAAGAAVTPEEVAANNAAEDFCVPRSVLDNFLARVGTAVSEARVLAFAERLGVHPGLVVGQLQFRLNRYNFLTHHLAKVREIVTAAALTDGYGRQLLEAVE